MKFRNICILTLIMNTASLLSAQTLEVFFLAGQSNADGSNSYYDNHGDLSKGPGLTAANAHYANPYSGIKYAYAHSNPFSGTVHRYLVGNLGDLRPAAWGMMGPEITLGRKLDALHTDDVALIKYTSPGTSLNTQWGPDDNLLYQDMVNFYNAQIALLSPNYTNVHLNTFFWHQGESDSGLTYESDFMAMFNQLRTDIGAPQLNAVLGMISENFDPGNTGVTPRSNISRVNQAIQSMSNTYSYIANTGSLTDIPLHDHIHFDANGQLIHGDRMARAYEANYLAVPEPASTLLLGIASAFALLRRRRM